MAGQCHHGGTQSERTQAITLRDGPMFRAERDAQRIAAAHAARRSKRSVTVQRKKSAPGAEGVKCFPIMTNRCQPWQGLF
jgi:hypothetical protein